MHTFYKALEDRFRGSRQLIKSRLEIYLPFVDPFFKLLSSPRMLDLGCGRGEWLELLSERGFSVKGIELNQAMFDYCVNRQFSVEKIDALTYLQQLPDASVEIISAFHVAEHIPFNELYQWLEQAYRTLVPGGLLILETPNPENILVSTESFYFDPTHRNPIPSPLMSFLVEYIGFARKNILRLQEKINLTENQVLELSDVLGGVSQDYAIVAQKSADEKIVAVFNEAFLCQYGVDLKWFLKNYEKSQKNKVENQIKKSNFNYVKKEMIQLINLSYYFKNKLDISEALNNKLQSDSGLMGKKARESSDMNAHLSKQLLHIYRSTSWRITGPIRKTKQCVMFSYRLLLRFSSFFFKRTFGFFLCKSIGIALRFPKVKTLMLRILQLNPNLLSRLKHFALARHLITPSEATFEENIEKESAKIFIEDDSILWLTPRACHLLKTLKMYLKKDNKEN